MLPRDSSERKTSLNLTFCLFVKVPYVSLSLVLGQKVVSCSENAKITVKIDEEITNLQPSGREPQLTKTQQTHHKRWIISNLLNQKNRFVASFFDQSVATMKNYDVSCLQRNGDCALDAWLLYLDHNEVHTYLRRRGRYRRGCFLASASGIKCIENPT